MRFDWVIAAALLFCSCALSPAPCPAVRATGAARQADECEGVSRGAGLQMVLEGHFEEAMKSLRCDVALNEKQFGAGDERTIESRLRLADVLIWTCELKEARAVLAAAREGAGRHPRTRLRDRVAVLSSAAETRAGKVEAARVWSIATSERCDEVAPDLCTDAFVSIAVDLRFGMAGPRPALARLESLIAAGKLSRSERQRAILGLHEYLRASGESEHADRFAREHGVTRRVADDLTWPAEPVEPFIDMCHGSAVAEELISTRDGYRRAYEAVKQCLEATLPTESRDPPRMFVTFLSDPAGKTLTVEAAGLSLEPESLDCAVRTTARIELPRVDRGFRLTIWTFPD